MQLAPRYQGGSGDHDDPVLALDGPPAAILGPAVRQRRRLAELLAGFTEEQWLHPSRCDGWTNRDVIVHLDSTNGFWAFSIQSGLRGEPTRFLATFDPVTSPAALVSAAAGTTSAEVLDRFAASTNAFVEVLESLTDDDWTRLAEAPPGHISVSALVHHALWDSWVHERDILLPLGIAPTQDAEEIAACLRYGAGLAPAFTLARDPSRRGVLAISTTEPSVDAVISVDGRVTVTTGRDDAADLVLGGDSVELLEALSIRRPLVTTVPEECSWLLAGLADMFDTPR